jgi:hypothetical protein
MHKENKSKRLSTDWTAHIQGWQRTEQSQSAYCKVHDLNYHCFIYWRRKLAGTTKPKTKLVPSSAFVPVKAYSTISSELTVTLPNGVIVRGIAADNLPVVKQLLGLHS